MSRKECNDLLLKQGFFKKDKESDPVPEKFKKGPYVAHDEL